MKPFQIKKSALTLLIVLVYLSPFNSDSVAQRSVGQIWYCRTTQNSPPKTIKDISMLSTSTVDTSLKIINIYIHIIRRNDGTGGLTNAQVNNWISILCNDYSIHKILIYEIGRSDLNNTTFYNGISDANYASLINTNTHSNAIDVYLLSSNDTYSRASGIPGIALAVGGDYEGTSVLSHEFGHCLGLYHTHSGRGCYDFANCSENIDESNCSTCGDLVCDTPADPCLAGNVDTDCNYIGDPSFSPDIHNIMSYAPPTCLSHLTTGQTLRIHSTILSNNAIFDQRSYEPYISGSNLVCTSNSTFTLHNRPSGTTVNWIKSSNLKYVSGQGTDNYLVKAYWYSSGPGWVDATITCDCGDGTIRKYISWVGKPNPNNIEFFSDPWGQEHELSTCETVSGEADHPYESMISAYQWDIPNASDWEITEEYSGGSSDYKYVEIDYWEDPAPSQELVRVRATNSCGTSSWKSIYWDVDDCGGYFMMISPNPADSYIDITFDKDQLVEAGLVAADQSYDFGSNPYFRIVDRYGQVKLTQKYSGKELTRLNISQLPPGLYVVQLVAKDKVSGSKIIISR